MLHYNQKHWIHAKEKGKVFYRTKMPNDIKKYVNN